MTKSALTFVLICVFTMASGSESLGAADGRLLWSYDTINPVPGSPSVDADGTVIAGTSAGLAAITNGPGGASIKWTFPAQPAGAAAISDNHIIYFNSTDGCLYALRPDGVQLWKVASDASRGCPAVGRDGTVYSSGRTHFYAVREDGTVKWRQPVPTPYSPASPVIGADGTIFTPSPDASILFAFSQDGAKRWERVLEKSFSIMVGESCSIGSGALYITAGGLHALDFGGVPVWTNESRGFLTSQPAVGVSGTLYATPLGAALCAISSAGAVLWQATTNGYQPGTTPAIASSGMIYHAAYNTLYAVRQNGSVAWSFSPKTGGPLYTWTSPTLADGGMIVVAFESSIYAIATDTNGPADSPWPMYRGNARHTGRIEKPSLQKARKQADSGFGFDVYARTDKNLTIESSTNLNTWQAMTSFVPSTVPAPVVDHTASNSPGKFYRAVEK